MKAVARRHRYVSTDSPGTDRISGHDPAVSHDGGGQRWQIVGGQIFLEGPIERDLAMPGRTTPRQITAATTSDMSMTGLGRLMERKLPFSGRRGRRPFLDTARTGL